MENPSDDCNNGAVAIDEINVIPEKDRPSTDSIEKPCNSDSQLILESIMAITSRNDEKYGRRRGINSESQKRKMDNLNLEILVTPTDSEALELELAVSTITRRQGISASETIVSTTSSSSIGCGGKKGSCEEKKVIDKQGTRIQDSSHLIFGDETCSSTSLLCTPSQTSSSSSNGMIPYQQHNSYLIGSRGFKASSRGESMPKSLIHACSRKSLTSTSSGSSTSISPPQQQQQQQRIYINNSPYSNPSTQLGVIQEEDEEE